MFGVTGATEPTHEIHGIFFFFFLFFGTLRRPMAARAESWLAGSGGDRRAPVPITESVGGVQRLGGVSEEYESTAA